MKRLIIINGPNLNLLGKREPEIYGELSFEDFFSTLKTGFPSCSLEYFQSNIEGEIIDKIQEVGFSYDGILLNAGGFTHTSVAIADAVAAVTCPVVEIHISQPKAREKERHISLLEKYCSGSISGFGLTSYTLGIEFFNRA
jgi:3-dehydroquinate dehydratase-2